MSVPEQLRDQATACGHLGSPLYELLLGRAADDFEEGGPVRRLLKEHRRDSRGSVLPLRLAGAVHRLALDGTAPGLAERYREWAAGEASPDPTWEAFRDVLGEHGGRLEKLVERPVQTNEVGRCAALLPGFFAVAARSGMPLRLLEVGASAGLNLNWSRYRYEAAGFASGPESSPVRIRFELDGRIAPVETVVAEAIGCDTNPVDPTTEEGRLTLLSYCWPDQAERLTRLRAALDLAARMEVRIEARSAGDWAAERLAAPVPGVASILFHSIVLQYLPDEQRGGFEAIVAEAGERATKEAPLAWLRMEPNGDRADVRITFWPGGEERRLLRAGFHGTPVAIES